MNKKYVYILFFTTTTGIGKMIRAVTNYKYNHVTFSLDKNLDNMYSFSRYKKNVPFVGGFTQESKLRYAGDNRVKIKVCKIEVSKQKYNDIKQYIKELESNHDEYLYNLFSAVTFPLKKQVKIKNSYICVEFVMHLVNKFKLVENFDENRFYTIKEFDNLLSDKCIYEGDFDNYIKSANKWANDNYPEEESITEATIDTIKQMKKLIKKTHE